jgi:hypothetical protein
MQSGERRTVRERRDLFMDLRTIVRLGCTAFGKKGKEKRKSLPLRISRVKALFELIPRVLARCNQDAPHENLSSNFDVL